MIFARLPQLVRAQAAEFAPKTFSAVRSWMSSFRAERVDQRLVARQVREHAQLDLRVVRRDQHVARVGDERAPDFAAELGPDRDVLQVGIAAAQAGPSRQRPG